MQTTFYTNMQGLQQSLMDLKSQANFSDPERSSKFSALVDSLMSFAEETAASSSIEETAPETTFTAASTVSTAQHIQNLSTVSNEQSHSTIVRQNVSNSESYLTNNLKYARDHKPTVKELMDATGLEFNEAGALIGVGAAGHNDMRDWSKIMSASDPAGALRIANGQLFNDVEWMPYTPDKGTISGSTVLSKTDNYTLAVDKDGNEKLFITDGKGRRLTEGTFNPEQFRYRSSLYGINTNNVFNLDASSSKQLASLLKNI